MEFNPTDVVRRRADGSLDLSVYLQRGRQARSHGWCAAIAALWGLLGRRLGWAGV